MTNTKKKNGNKRKLLGAVGMLTVSAAMLVSSTFAWFSLNRTVTAQTMTISAKSADPFLKISANGTNFYTALDATADPSNDTGAWAIQTTAKTNTATAADAKLKLIAPKKIGSTMEWVWNKSTNPAQAQGKLVTDASNSAVTLSVAEGNENADRSAIMTGKVAGEALVDAFVLKQTLTFQNIAQDAKGTNLKIDSVTFSRDNATITGDAASTFHKAARILVVNEAGAYALYKFDTNNAAGTLIPAENDADGTQMGGTGKNVIATELAAKGTTSITIYMYFDGNAAEAYTNNAFDLNGVHASFQFSIDPETAANP